MKEQPAAPEQPRKPRVDPLIGQLIGGRFKVIAPLGSGGVARVYRALQIPLNRQVALKVVRPDVDDEQRAQFELRFLREAALAGRLSHPNIVTVFDFGRTEDSACFIAMELLEGVTMRKLFDGEPLGTDRAVRLALGVARGLRHAHKRGLVHRDIKPSNIFLVIDDEGNELPKLLDFGLVKGDDNSTITRSGAFMGTPHYIAPEQARGLDTVDGRADLYSLGCILYRMLTGVLPYFAENPMTIALHHVRSPYPPMRTRRPDVPVPETLERIVMRCMEKDPAARYPDAGALVRDLEAWLGEDHTVSDDSVVGMPLAESTETLDKPPPRRARWGVALLALMSVGGGAGAGLFLLASDPDPVPPPAPRVVERVIEVPVPVEAPPEVPPVETPKPVSRPPAATQVSAPEPATTPAPSTSPKPAPPNPAPAPAKTDASGYASGAAVADGIRFEADHAGRALAFLNTATEDQLRAAGVYGRGVNIILDGRPWSSLEAFGSTSYIGEKTVKAVADATR
ncbi:MAG: serine/threonine protein kinase [Alphaproteobacteria bacterium]|nr:serine/threonine protein kinase [Alphaproteobacteria bacterium]